MKFWPVHAADILAEMTLKVKRVNMHFLVDGARAVIEDGVDGRRYEVIVRPLPDPEEEFFTLKGERDE